MTSKVWYVVALGLLAVAAAIGITGYTQRLSTIEGMHRVAMPGRHELVLPAGTSTLYLEERSLVEGRRVIAPPELRAECKLLGAGERGAGERGAEIPLADAVGKGGYSTADYRGRSRYDAAIANPGTYVLACEEPTGQPFAIAVGSGTGSWVVVIVGGLVPGLAGIAMALAVLAKRARQRRRRSAAAPGAA